MNAPALQFDAERHQYMVGGTILPSVTTVLKPLYQFEGVPPDVLENARRRGTAVHLATEEYDTGRLDIAALPDSVLPYVVAWKRFRKDAGVEILKIEHRGYHEDYRYAGTVDRVVRWPDGAVGIVDIKTTAAISKVDALQTAAYAAIEEQDGTTITRRHTIQLRKDGTYRLQPWTGKRDFAVFLSALTLHNWRLTNGYPS
jgi:hypothetical protein